MLNLIEFTQCVAGIYPNIGECLLSYYLFIFFIFFCVCIQAGLSADHLIVSKYIGYIVNILLLFIANLLSYLQY